MTESTAVHYCASSYLGWNVADTPDDAKTLRLKLDTPIAKLGIEIWIWRVPLPKEAAYTFKWYRPQVEGVELIDTILLEGSAHG